MGSYRATGTVQGTRIQWWAKEYGICHHGALQSRIKNQSKNHRNELKITVITTVQLKYLVQRMLNKKYLILVTAKLKFEKSVGINQRERRGKNTPGRGNSLSKTLRVGQWKHGTIKEPTGGQGGWCSMTWDEAGQTGRTVTGPYRPGQGRWVLAQGKRILYTCGGVITRRIRKGRFWLPHGEQDEGGKSTSTETARKLLQRSRRETIGA